MAAIFKRIESADVKLGMRFSAPVFFEDGQNMFLSEGKPAHQYHIDSLVRWNVPYLLTYGHVITEDAGEKLSSPENEGTLLEEVPESQAV